ncbi:hypothetical protein KM043_018792 [Ampulex compressa]|nr:hypothetical protein KM043_018792 [Ampulex compressa]
MDSTTKDIHVYGAKGVGSFSTGPVSGGRAGPAGSSSYDRETFVVGDQAATSKNMTGTYQGSNNPSADLSNNHSATMRNPKRHKPHSLSWSRMENKIPRECTPRFIVIEKNTGSFSNVSPFLIDRILTNLIGKVNKVRKMKDCLLVETLNDRQSKILLALKEFGNMSVHTFAHKSLNHNKGIITCSDLLNCTVEEIQDELADQGVIDVRRITRKRDGEIMPTASLILTFNKPFLPDSIKAGFHIINVRPYIPNPMRCFKCQRYGHTAVNCSNDQICACGSPPHDDTECALPMICVNCGNQHSARSKNCPTFKQEQEIQRIKITKKIPYNEAKRLVKTSSRIKPSSYAEITDNKTTTNQSNNMKELATLLIPEISKIVQMQLNIQIASLKSVLTNPSTAELTPKTIEMDRQSSRKERTHRHLSGAFTAIPDKEPNKQEQKGKQNVSLLTIGVKTTTLKQSNKKFVTTEYEETDMDVDTPAPKPTTTDTPSTSNTNNESDVITFSKSKEKENEYSSSDSSIIAAPAKHKPIRKRKSDSKN